MNRLQLKKQIMKEGIDRGIRFQEVKIYSRLNPVGVFVTVVNNKRSNWASQYRIERLIDDMMPLERPYKIKRIALDDHVFEEGDIVEVNNLWFSRSEDDDEEDIQILSASIDWGCGWIRGRIEKVYDGYYHVEFAREVYFTQPSDHYRLETSDVIFTDTRMVEEAIECGKLKLLEVGKLLRVGCYSWQIRLID